MRTIIYTLLFTVLLPLTAQAHHAFRVVYDFSKTETLEGRVVKLELVNPHARIFINVTGENGEIEEWLIEGPGRLALERRGWTDDMFDGGVHITAVGNPSSEGHKAIWLEKITMPDGTEIIDPLIADQLAIEEERRERARRATQ
jgi:hypothetical protein